MARRKKGHLRTLNRTTKVTILIPVFNEEKVVKQKLENCMELDYPQQLLEIMVCSDCSTDRTAAIVKSFPEKNITFYDYRERSGKTGVINKSVAKAKGDIVVLTDANTMLNRDAVSKMVSLYASPDIGAVLGCVRLVAPRGSCGIEKEIVYRDFEADLKYKEGLFGATMGAFGGFYSIRKEFFESLPDNAYSNDDLLIPLRILRMGDKVILDKEAISIEDTAQSVEEEFKRRVRIGAGSFQALFLLADLFSPARGIIFFFYFSHKVLRWFSPFLLLGALFSNILLIEYLPFTIIFVLQVFFYGGAGIGALYSRRSRRIPFISSLYHFVSMNVAVLLGFFRYLRGIKSATWQSTERTEV
jgi:cellulose synthase/poly-beta-1,6-N-acetylglucosamine synthase-like glycosyltransferase